MNPEEPGQPKNRAETQQPENVKPPHGKQTIDIDAITSDQELLRYLLQHSKMGIRSRRGDGTYFNAAASPALNKYGFIAGQEGFILPVLPSRISEMTQMARDQILQQEVDQWQVWARSQIMSTIQNELNGALGRNVELEYDTDGFFKDSPACRIRVKGTNIVVLSEQFDPLDRKTMDEKYLEQRLAEFHLYQPALVKELSIHYANQDFLNAHQDRFAEIDAIIKPHLSSLVRYDSLADGRYIILGNDKFCVYRKDAEGKYITSSDTIDDLKKRIVAFQNAVEKKADLQVCLQEIINRYKATDPINTATSPDDDDSPSNTTYHIRQSGNDIYFIHKKYELSKHGLQALDKAVDEAITASEALKSQIIVRIQSGDAGTEYRSDPLFPSKRTELIAGVPVYSSAGFFARGLLHKQEQSKKREYEAQVKFRVLIKEGGFKIEERSFKNVDELEQFIGDIEQNTGRKKREYKRYYAYSKTYSVEINGQGYGENMYPSELRQVLSNFIMLKRGSDQS